MNADRPPTRRISLDWLRAPLLGCVVVAPLVLLAVLLRWWLDWQISAVQLALGLTVAYAVAWRIAQSRIDRDERFGREEDPDPDS
ncbi:MAG: hypothetical protein DWQ36_07190 [Acidobacteria bacterium]|nr:MAG: hypothetical protein DWQ30_23410 [Acidobacteriota bacterium]REK09326.1 MAG: hypothetical protein DWQ36_07190 [Acidobacteriota bacterium]